MRVGTGIEGRTASEIARSARNAEQMGYDFISSSETAHNPFLPIALAAEHTERMDLRTSIALAFPRSPMDTAYMAWDLQAMSGGRFVLGLGSQVRGHIARRFGVKWTSPAPRMKEYVSALRAIWDCWQTGSKLDFQGDQYKLNLMPPFFNPGPIEHPRIRVYLAAVNPAMLRVAGEVCDGVLLHSFNTARYTREVVLPNLERGAARAGRSLEEIDVSGGGLIVVAETEQELEAATRTVRDRIAFYASTRSYAGVMEAHGWGETAEKLYRMSVDGDWPRMGREITDEMAEAFAVTGTYDDIVGKVKDRYRGTTSITLSVPARTAEARERLKDLIRRLQAS